MNNWKLIFATVVIFGAGVITGGMLVNYVQHCHKAARSAPVATVPVPLSATNQSVRAAENVKPHLPENMSKQFMQKLDEALVLAPAQRESIRKIIGEGQTQIRKVLQESRVQIREVLTPEQRTQFDELIKRPVRKPAPDTNAPAS